jgi:hypothetical protein
MDEVSRCLRPHALMVGLLVLSSAATLPPASAIRTGDTFSAPYAMIFTGGPLHGRVILDDIRENVRILTYAHPAARPAERAPGRPFIDVWLFWGPQWAPLAGNEAALERLRVADANQTGKFYPARAGEGALLVLEPTLAAPRFSARSLEPVAVEILRRHGVPVRVK